PIKFQLEAIAPIQNKIGHFVSSPLLRNILGQSRSNLDLRRVMDDGKILLVNLSKGKLGDDVSSLLGSFLVTAFQLAAIAQAYVRLLIDGSPSRPFSMRTLPPGCSVDSKRPAIIRNVSRHRYARPVGQIEDEIARALASA